MELIAKLTPFFISIILQLLTSKKAVAHMKIIILGVIIVVASIAGGTVWYYISTTPPTPENILVWGHTETMAGWEPATLSNPTNYIASYLVFERLLKHPKGTTELAPELATSWQQVEPDLWEFKLREGVKFHDGTPFNATAVKFSLERTIEMKKGVSFAINSIIKEVIVVDTYTVRIRTFEPFIGLPYVMACAPTGIVSPSAVEKWGADFEGKGATGTGPFRFVEWIKGDRIVVVRNDEYWDKARIPTLDKVIVKQFVDAATLALEIEGGTVDVAYRFLYYLDWERLEADPEIRVQKCLAHMCSFLVMNPTKPPLDNKLVREAIAYAIDYEALLTTGTHATRVYSIYPTDWPVYHDGQKIYDYDPNRSKELLAEAGYPTGIPETIELYHRSDRPSDSVWAPIYQSNLADVGIQVSTKSLDFVTFLSGTIEPGFPLFIYMHFWIYYDPDYSAFFTYHSRGGGSKRFGINDTRLDDLVIRARVEEDPQKRLQDYKEMQDIANLDLLPFIFVGREYDGIFYRDNIKGIELGTISWIFDAALIEKT